MPGPADEVDVAVEKVDRLVADRPPQLETEAERLAEFLGSPLELDIVA